MDNIYFFYVLHNNIYIFVGKYIQFLKLAIGNKLSEAASLYIELLRSNICPT